MRELLGLCAVVFVLPPLCGPELSGNACTRMQNRSAAAMAGRLVLPQKYKIHANAFKWMRQKCKTFQNKMS